MKYYNTEVIEGLLKSVNLMSLIKSEVNTDIYRFHGMLFTKLCPFCKQEKTFLISGNKYFCFGCGKGGNAIDFIMNVRKTTFTEAVEYLAKKYKYAKIVTD